MICAISTAASAQSPPLSPDFMSALSIGFVVFLGSIIAMPFTGGSMNPARTLGPAVAYGEFKDIWIYFVGPIVGAFIGSYIGKMVNFNN